MQSSIDDHGSDHKGDHDGNPDAPLECEEIFLDQLKDAFIFFTAVTVAAMDAIAHARHHYQQQCENHLPEASKLRARMHGRGQA